MVRYNLFLLSALFSMLFIVGFASATWTDNGELVQNVSDCGTLNTTGATYYLNSSVNSSRTCFIVNASNITFDGGGYNTTGNNSESTFGIELTNVENINISSISLYNFNKGILIYSSDEIYFFNITSRFNFAGTTYGFSGGSGVAILDGSSNVTITDSNISDNVYGLFLYSVDNSLIEDSFIYNNSVGVDLYSTNSTVNNNYIHYGSNFTFASNLAGIVLEGGYFNTISNNSIFNYSYGLRFIGENNPNIDSNIIDKNGYGMYGTSTNSNDIIENNILTSNFYYGIYFTNCRNCLFNNNTVQNTSLYNGLTLSYSNNNTISNSTLTFNGGYGIYTGYGGNNTIENTEISFNSNHGLFMTLGENNTLNFVNLFNNSLSGILSNDNYVKILNSNIYNNLNGSAIIISDYVNNFTLANNSIYHNLNGLSLLTGSNGGFINNNNIYNNTNYEILDTSGSSTTNSFIYNNSNGKIEWTSLGFLQNLTLKGNLIFGDNIVISQNLTFVNLSNFSVGNINSSANVTLYNPALGLVNATITRDGSECNSTTTPSCYNFTKLNVPIVIFNVSSWSSYSISGEADISAPNVTLTSPENDTNSPTHAYNFTFNVTDNSNYVPNCTLIIDGNEISNLINTESGLSVMNGFYNSTMSLGQHNWSVNCTDYSGNSFMTEERTLNVTNDTYAPAISLISPTGSSTATAYNFTFNISEHNIISSCSLIVDGSIINSLSNLALVSSNETPVTGYLYNSSFAIGTYTWSVNCTDDYGNVGNSSLGTFTVTSEEEDENNNGGGGGGSVVPGFVREIKANESELNLGQTLKQMKENYRITFNVKGMGHSVTIKNITNNSVSIVVNSTPQYATLLVGESKKFDVDNDGYYDVLVSLLSITGKNADVKMQTINEAIPVAVTDTDSSTGSNTDSGSGTENVNDNISNDLGNDLADDKPSSLVYWIIGIILLVVIILVIVFSIKSNKKRAK